MKKGTVQVVSFLSGLTLAAVILGVTINKSSTIRNEIESQITSVLKTTRLMVDAYRSIASKSKAAATIIKGEPGEKTKREETAEVEAKEQANNQWNSVEAQAGR